MTDDSESRRQGVDLGDLDDDLEAHDYPTTAQELYETFGERDIDLVDGKQRFGVVLAPYIHETEGESKETFDSAEEVRTAILNLVGSDAVGREGYSDRGIDSDDEARGEESL